MKKARLKHNEIALGVGIDADNVPDFLVVSSWDDDDDGARRTTLHYAGDSDTAAYACFRLTLGEGFSNLVLSARG